MRGEISPSHFAVFSDTSQNTNLIGAKSKWHIHTEIKKKNRICTFNFYPTLDQAKQL